MSRLQTAPVVLHTRVVTETGGGPEKTILNSPRFMQSLGYRALCAYMHPPLDPGFESLREKARKWNAPLVAIEDRGPLDVRVVTELLSLCRRERVRIWHAHDYKSNAIGVLLCRFWPMKLITTVHGWVKHTTRTPLYYGLDRIWLRCYDRVICVSEDLYRKCREYGVRHGRLVLLENCIDATEFSRTMTTVEAKARLGIPASRLLIGAVGRLSAEKGFDILIRAVNRLLQSGLDVQLVIIGNGDEHSRLQQLITELGLESSVMLLGFRSDVVQYYQAMDVFALSSLREGLPNVLLEAMAFEVPVVATRIAGIPRVIRDGETGILVEAGEVESLSQAIGRLLENSELRTTLGRAARKRIESNHSFMTRMQRLRTIYDDLLSNDRERVVQAELVPSREDETKVWGVPAGRS